MPVIITSASARNITAQTSTRAAPGFPAPNSFEIRVLQNDRRITFCL